eukprot:scaffold369869_cov45-Prasinocladus_malaysianus.AAC.1
MGTLRGPQTPGSPPRTSVGCEGQRARGPQAQAGRTWAQSPGLPQRPACWWPPSAQGWSSGRWTPTGRPAGRGKSPCRWTPAEPCGDHPGSARRKTPPSRTWDRTCPVDTKVT